MCGATSRGDPALCREVASPPRRARRRRWPPAPRPRGTRCCRARGRPRRHPQQARDPHRDANGGRIAVDVHLTPRQARAPAWGWQTRSWGASGRPPRNGAQRRRAARGRARPRSARRSSFASDHLLLPRAARRPSGSSCPSRTARIRRSASMRRRGSPLRAARRVTVAPRARSALRERCLPPSPRR